MSKRRPYTRPMAGWWRKNPFFVEYMIHEGTALFVAAYGLVLLAGLVVWPRVRRHGMAGSPRCSIRWRWSSMSPHWR